MFKDADRKINTLDTIALQSAYPFYTRLIAYTYHRMGEDPLNDIPSAQDFTENLEKHLNAKGLSSAKVAVEKTHKATKRAETRQWTLRKRKIDCQLSPLICIF